MKTFLCFFILFTAQLVTLAVQAACAFLLALAVFLAFIAFRTIGALGELWFFFHRHA